MAETPDFKERLQLITKRNRKVVHKRGKAWPLEKRIEVVTQWLVIGNLKQVAAISGVGYDLVRAWKGQPWWAELEAEIRQTQNIEMDVKLSKIVEKSLEATMDRVENGDFIYDQKSGQIRRKPASLKDVHKVAVDLIDRREVLRKGVDDRNEGSKVSVDEHLKMLATQMAQWFEPKKQPIVLEEVEDAVYAEVQEAGADAGDVRDNDGQSGTDSMDEEREAGRA